VQQTAYTSYAYLIPSLAASRITQHAREDLARCNHSVRCHFHIKALKTAKGKKRAAPAKGDSPPQEIATTSGTRHSYPTKRKREELSDPEEDGSVINISSDAEGEGEDEDEELLKAVPPPRSRRGQELSISLAPQKTEARPNVIKVDFDSGEEIYFSDFNEEIYAPDLDEGDWMYSHRSHPRQRRRTKSPPTMADLSDF